jgi:hypothetical protein
MTRWLAGVVVLAGLAAFAEDAAQRRAREELERQLSQLVEEAPSRVRVEFLPVDDPNCVVEGLEIVVDGKPLKVPTAAAVAGWVQEGPMPVGVLDVKPGRHQVAAKVTVHNTASPMMSDEGDSRWKVAGDVTFEVRAGLEVRVIVSPVRDPTQADVAKRLKLTFPSKPVMVAKLDDGTMPEPVKAKPAPVVIDAGPPSEVLAAARVTEQIAEASPEITRPQPIAAAQPDESPRGPTGARPSRPSLAQAPLTPVVEEPAAATEPGSPAEPPAPQVLQAQGPPAEARLEARAIADAGAAVEQVETTATRLQEERSSVAVWVAGGGFGMALIGLVIFLARRSGRVPELKD